MLTLYGVYRSRASRPLWLLAEAGVPFAHVPVIQAYRLADPAAADAPLNTDSAGYLAVNPMGQVPALTDDSLLLTESMAITLHLAKAYGGALGPQTPQEEALVLNWAFFAATSIEEPALAIMKADPGDAATLQSNATRLHRPLHRLEAHLAAHDGLLDRFTVADICLAECLRYAQGHEALAAAHPTAFAWLARCQARPAFQAMWARRMEEPA